MLHAFAIAAVVLAAAARAEKTGPTLFSHQPIRSSVTLVRAQPSQGATIPAQVTGRGVAVHHQPRLEAGACGMPIIAADASIDPTMVVPIPEEVKRASKIRVIEPPACRSNAAEPAR